MRLVPGATVGILGGGQLGRMMLYEAHRLGLQVHVLDPDADSPAAKRADRYVRARLDDAQAVAEFASGCDVVTYETEHVPSLGLDAAAGRLLPSADSLTRINDRLVQRRFLEANGLPQPRFEPVDDAPGLQRALATLGTPTILKTRRGGYDGKGQVRLRAGDDAAAVWRRVGVPSILEAFVPFDKEVSVVLARGRDGQVVAWPLAENVHRDGILHSTMAPADVPPSVAEEAVRIATRVVEALGHVGVAAVEMFLVGDDLLINEVAPRVHNSGHFTLGAAVTSQFEQHIRAIAGWPLGDASLTRPAAMVNLLGDMWKHGEPAWEALLSHPGVRLHLYGKKDARPGRKMGHFLVLGPSAEVARRDAEAAFQDVAG